MPREYVSRFVKETGRIVRTEAVAFILGMSAGAILASLYLALTV